MRLLYAFTLHTWLSRRWSLWSDLVYISPHCNRVSSSVHHCIHSSIISFRFTLCQIIFFSPLYDFLRRWGGGDSFSALYAIRRWGYFLPEVTVTWGFLEGAIERGARMKKLIRSSSELNLSPFSCSSKTSDKGLQCEHIRVVTSTTSSPPPHCSEERVQSPEQTRSRDCVMLVLPLHLHRSYLQSECVLITRQVYFWTPTERRGFCF